MTTAATAPDNDSTIASTLRNHEVLNHLLFHKALIAENDGGERLNEYIQMLHEGEHVAIKDSFDRSIALAFDLVIQEQLNPWDIDLVKFSTLYLEHARENEIDLVTAGRIILLAWTVLKLQSDDLVVRSEQVKDQEDAVPDWEDLPDWGLSGNELDFTDRVRQSPRAPIDEKVWHEGDRKVTLMELVDAFESVRREAEQRRVHNEQREAMRTKNRNEGREHFRGRVHREDLEEDIQLIWDRIQGRNGSTIRLGELYRRGDVWDFVTAFNGVLFLHRNRKIDVWQEDFPRGPVLMRNLELEAVATTPKARAQADPEAVGDAS